jgi:hypothetical protein
MVSPDTRNNLIVLVLIVAICIIVGSFIVAFSNNLERTSERGMVTVQTAADNVTASTKEMTGLLDKQAVIFNEGFNNLSRVLNAQYNLTVEEREQQAKNLGVFLKAFTNQTNTMVGAIDDQKIAFVDTLKQSQNLTKVSQNLTKENQQISIDNKNLTQERNGLLKTQIAQFDEIISSLKEKNNNDSNNNTIRGNLSLQPR